MRHPECILFGGGTLVIYDRERDCFAICALIRVNGVQFLQAARAARARQPVTR